MALFPDLLSDSLPGSRHDWNLIVGTVVPDVLRWLRTDLEDPQVLADIALDFDCEGRANVKCEPKEGKKIKFILAGAMNQETAKGQLCTLKLTKLLPLPRFRAFFAAWKAANRPQLEAMHEAARRFALTTEFAGDMSNVTHFLGCSLDEWLLCAAELNIFRACEAPGGFKEPRHQDGGASVLHMGFTYFGRRRLFCELGARDGKSATELGARDGKSAAEPAAATGPAAAPEPAAATAAATGPAAANVLSLLNTPGVLYCGGLTGPHHKVEHEAAFADELFSHPQHKGLSMSVMLRTGLFPANRARTMGGTPDPGPFFFGLSAIFKEALSRGVWRLPALTACQAAYAQSRGELEATPPKRPRNKL
jgi:hypothetical protein